MPYFSLSSQSKGDNTTRTHLRHIHILDIFSATPRLEAEMKMCAASVTHTVVLKQNTKNPPSKAQRASQLHLQLSFSIRIFELP